MSHPGHPGGSAGSGRPTGPAGKRPTPNIYSPAAPTTIRVSVALAAAASVCTALAFVFAGQLLACAIGSGTQLGGPLAGTVVFAVLAAGLSALVIAYTGKAAGREEGHVRGRMLRHVLALGPVDRTSERSGALGSSATDGAERVALYRMTFVGPMIASAISPVLVLIIVAVAIDWVSALILFIAVPAIPLIVGGFQMAFRQVSSKSRAARQKLAAEYLDALQGLTTLGLLNASERTQKKLAASGEHNRRTIMSLLAVNQLVILVVEGVFSLFMVAAVAWLAMARLSSGHIDFGQAVALILISLVLLEPLAKVGEFFYLGMGGRAAQRGIGGFLSAPVRVRSGSKVLPADVFEDGLGANVPGTAGNERAGSSGNTHPLPDDPAGTQPLVAFRGAQFSYGELTVLDGVDLEVKRGEHVAIVGASGAGKSTIAALVQRNLPIAAGQLFLAGVDATELDTRSARSLSATVGQTTFLFTGTLRENLLIAAPNATDEELWEALDTANLRQEVEAMPTGLDTVVGERGYSLSGGQAQRVAIARALLTRAPLLVLDEPTSQVDLEGEAAILAAIEKAVQGRTVLTIAHRPSTLRSVDRVLRLENGQLTEVTA